MAQIKVLIVDDSAVVRQVLTTTLSQDPGINVIGAVADPVFAMARMQTQWPDVIVLDVEMPRMDGITFLKKLMDERPTPVVICSTLTEKGAETTMQALAAGAVSIVTKPKVGLKQFLQDDSESLVVAVKAAARANLRRLSASTAVPVQAKLTADAILPANCHAMAETTDRVVAIAVRLNNLCQIEVREAVNGAGSCPAVR
ncbi:response regulator [Methylobacter sp.]|uniref:response regulator n=1 Tax=Methylobacter sp. TaxID=2051955 RepID=UPI002FDFE36A